MDESSRPKGPIPAYFRRPYFGRNSHYIVRDLCALLQQQMDTLTENGLSDLSARELEAYRAREEKIRELRRELEDFGLWASS
jgi:hypothetical protein